MCFENNYIYDVDDPLKKYRATLMKLAKTPKKLDPFDFQISQPQVRDI
jgi:hypothetical protein